MKECQAVGCDKLAVSLDYCSMHYTRLRRHGDVTKRLRAANGECYLHRGRKRFGFTDEAKRGNVQEAVVIVERLLGKKLPRGAVVHHVNENPLDNRHANLVVLQNQGMHNIVHGRAKALAATGNARAKPCRFCHKYELPGVLKRNGSSHYHLTCAAADQRRRREKRRTA